MIKVLMLDLGDTLVSGGDALPNVSDALDVIARFVTLDREQLSICLVSDYLNANPPDSQTDIDRLFDQYVELLDSFHLRQHFEPVEQRITLSTNAGVHKPDRKVFDLALVRLESSASLAECLFVTENTEHLRACKHLEMQTLAFGSPLGFIKWARGPLSIASAIGPDIEDNMRAAIQFYAEREYHFSTISSLKVGADHDYELKGRVWYALTNPILKDLVDVHVELPSTLTIDLGANESNFKVIMQSPTKEMIEEATNYVKSLLDNHSIDFNSGNETSKATHVVEESESNQRRLVRKKYTY